MKKAIIEIINKRIKKIEEDKEYYIKVVSDVIPKKFLKNELNVVRFQEVIDELKKLRRQIKRFK